MKRVSRAGPYLTQERRDRADRRLRVWWSICYGSFKPRRRTPSRRLDDSRFHSLDWYSAHLLAVALSILLLNVADAFLTLLLLQGGGVVEANPIMAGLIYRSVAAFAALKMALTSVSLILMVILARHRFMRLLRVEWVLYGVLIAYVSLIGHEVWMLKAPFAPPIL
jgi:Domain of unknown function (DUF5658)